MPENHTEIRKLELGEFPEALLEIPEPPKELFIRGSLPNKDTVLLAVVGSRKYTSYGKEACENIIGGLSGYDITIVSGLALGIDSIAHKAALQSGLKTIAVPGSGLDPKVLYPRTNLRLSDEIVKSGGALLSEFRSDFKATVWSFPQRNRIMAGLSKAVLVVEASDKSGTLITARLALDYNRDVYAIPSSIFSHGAKGSNRLIKGGATPITSSEDLLDALGFDISKKKETSISANDDETKVLDLLAEPLSKDDLLNKMNMPTNEANILLSIMEIKGLIKESLGSVHKT